MPLDFEVTEVKCNSALDAFPKSERFFCFTAHSNLTPNSQPHTGPHRRTNAHAVLLALARPGCDFSSRLKGPTFNATGTIAGSYTFPTCVARRGRRRVPLLPPPALT